jgi:DNA-directed RNA polymerase specialized sigma24 family protein
MRVSVLSVWRAGSEVIAGMDPWDVVDEAWSSMAQKSFTSAGPFLPHALTVARNKAIDARRRTEAKRGDRSMDAPLLLRNELADSRGADADYFHGLDQVAAIQKLALAEEAIHKEGILSAVERDVFISVRVKGRSRAAVGRELDPAITGQRVGQIVAQAFIKIQGYVKKHEDVAPKVQRQRKKGG